VVPGYFTRLMYPTVHDGLKDKHGELYGVAVITVLIHDSMCTRTASSQDAT